MPLYYVYRITCHDPVSREKYYYGSRGCCGHPRHDDHYWSSSRYVAAAMARFGRAAFTKKIIAIYPTRAEALQLEIRLHARLDVKDHPLFFNRSNQTSTRFITAGSPSAASRTKMSQAQRGKTVSPETRARIAEANRGRVFSDEAKAKMRAAKIGRALSPETKAKMAEAHRGKELSPETKAKLAAAQRGTVRSAETRAKIRAVKSTAEAKAKVAEAHRGKVVSDETKAKLRAVRQGTTQTAETRAKIAEARQAYEARRTPEERHCSDETRAKIAAAQRQRWASKAASKTKIHAAATEEKSPEAGEPT